MRKRKTTCKIDAQIRVAVDSYRRVNVRSTVGMNLAPGCGSKPVLKLSV